MTRLAAIVCLATALQSAPAPRTYVAYTARYAPGAFRGPAALHGLPLVPCMISSPTLRIGTWALLTGVRTGRSRWCQVTDTSAPADRQRHITRGPQIETNAGVYRDFCAFYNGPWRWCRVVVQVP